MRMMRCNGEMKVVDRGINKQRRGEREEKA